jgi:hypothetical protein
MSGGSYNYLCSALDLDDILNKQYDLEQMADRLEGLPEAEFPGAGAAGHMTRRLLQTLKLWESHAAISLGMLTDVWKAVEWWDSCDWGPDQVKEELVKLVNGAHPSLKPDPPLEDAPKDEQTIKQENGGW